MKGKGTWFCKSGFLKKEQTLRSERSCCHSGLGKEIDRHPALTWTVESVKCSCVILAFPLTLPPRSDGKDKVSFLQKRRGSVSPEVLETGKVMQVETKSLAFRTPGSSARKRQVDLTAGSLAVSDNNTRIHSGISRNNGV